MNSSSDVFQLPLVFISLFSGSGIGAAICAIAANNARQALHKGEIQKSSLYRQHSKSSH